MRASLVRPWVSVGAAAAALAMSCGGSEFASLEGPSGPGVAGGGGGQDASADSTAGTTGAAGTGATSGSSGTAGTSGSAGSGGTGGTGGTAGTVGSSGTGGTSGSAGSGGKGGTGGTAGTAGSSGTGGTGGTAGSSGTAGTAGSSGTGGTAGTAGSSGTGGTGGALLPEDCLNGVDDNSDGLADCQDPQCKAQFSCTDSAPAGWSGLGWVDDDLAVPCPPAYSAIKLFDKSKLSWSPDTCGCGCSDTSGVTCASTLSCNAGNMCNGAGLSVQVTKACTPYTLPNPGMGEACVASVPKAAGGWCNAKANVLAKPPVTWPQSARACLRSDGGACSEAGKKCVPNPPPGAKFCIGRAGNWSCPAGAYTKLTVFYDGQTNDTRGCSANGCGCGAVGGASCGCSNCGVGIHSDSACSVGGKVVPANGQCTTFSWSAGPNASILLFGANVASPGACPSYGNSTPTGEVSASGPVTVCCSP